MLAAGLDHQDLVQVLQGLLLLLKFEVAARGADSAKDKTLECLCVDKVSHVGEAALQAEAIESFVVGVESVEVLARVVVSLGLD